MERDCRKEVHTVVALSNSEGQTAGGTRERQQRRELATTPQGAGRVGVTKKAENLPDSTSGTNPVSILNFEGVACRILFTSIANTPKT